MRIEQHILEIQLQLKSLFPWQWDRCIVYRLQIEHGARFTHWFLAFAISSWLYKYFILVASSGQFKSFDQLLKFTSRRKWSISNSLISVFTSTKRKKNKLKCLSNFCVFSSLFQLLCWPIHSRNVSPFHKTKNNPLNLNSLHSIFFFIFYFFQIR